MTLHPRRWMAAGLYLLIAACDGGQDAADKRAQQAPATSNQGAESIIREDVLAETDMPPEPAVEAVALTLNFAAAEGKLPAAAVAKLDAMLKQPVIARGGCIVVRGHTDSRGSDQQNLRASERRAQLVADYLAAQGIAKDRLRVIGLGERRPVAPNANADGTDFPEGRARNRRVTVDARFPAGGQSSCDGEMVPRDGVEPPTP